MLLRKKEINYALFSHFTCLVLLHYFAKYKPRSATRVQLLSTSYHLNHARNSRYIAERIDYKT